MEHKRYKLLFVPSPSQLPSLPERNLYHEIYIDYSFLAF